MTAIAILLSLVLMAVCAIVKPTKARCPPGHDLRTGIRRSGHFECWPNPIGNAEGDGIMGRPDRSVQPPWTINARIHCTSGQLPIVVDYRTVGCQRGSTQED